MLGHYLTFAIRKFARTPVTAALNILGLAIGLACFMGAYGVANYWSLADSHFANADRTYVVTTKIDAGHFHVAPIPVGLYLREDFPELEAVARVDATGELIAVVEDRKFALKGAAAEAEFLKIFDFEFIEGDPRGALNAPDKVILTESAAQRLFGDEPALGKSIRLSSDFSPTVSGVIKTVKAPSHMGDADATLVLLRFDFLHAWTAERMETTNWLSLSTFTYVLFPEDGRSITPDSLADQLDAFVQRRMPEDQKSQRRVSLKLTPLSHMVALSINTPLSLAGPAVPSITTLFVLLGLMVLAVACINYANLATAQAAGRGKEIGMRKVLGASRFQVLIQYWSEAMAFAALAAIVALIFLWTASPVVANLTDIFDLRVGLFSNAAPFLVVAGAIVAVSFVGSLYPVFILARVRPVEALRAGSVRAGPKFVMRFLVGVQFAVASLFLMMVIIIIQQNTVLRELVLEQTNPVVILQDNASIAIGYEALAADLADRPGIVAVTQLNYTPFGVSLSVSAFSSRADGLGPTIDAIQNEVGYDFFSVFDTTILAGRVFDRERDNIDPEMWEQFQEGELDRPLPVVIDSTLSDQMGFSSPSDAVGRIFYAAARGGEPVNRQYEVIGVVEPTPLIFFTLNISSNIYFLAPPGGRSQRPVIQLVRDDVPAALQAIRDAVEARDPYALVRMRFLDEAFETGYQIYGGAQTVLTALSVLAFAIAVVGLFAMAAYVAGRRRHEIGIRKTLGASTSNIVGLLLRDFSTPVLIGNLIAWPLAYLGAIGYLSLFVKRIDLTPLPWLLGLALTIAIAWLAVGGQAWRAARINPAEVLQHE